MVQRFLPGFCSDYRLASICGIAQHPKQLYHDAVFRIVGSGLQYECLS